jgi:hypothetical protein
MLAESTEYVETVLGGPDAGTIQVGDIELALTHWGDKPADADWHPASAYSPTTHVARLLVGPQGGALTLTAGKWQLYTRIADVPERLVLLAGDLLVT